MRNRPFPTLDSPRLHLRGLRADDAAFLVSLDTDPVVIAFISDGVMTPEDAAKFAEVQIQLAQFRWHAGKWIAELRDTAEPVGWVELGKLGGPDRDDLQVGYQFAPAHWGRGYAIEAVRTVLDYAFDRMQLDRVPALVHPNNERSLALLRKLGFTRIGGRRHGEVWCDHLMLHASR